MRMSDLQNKDIVDMDGKRIGRIIDILVDKNGNMQSLIIQKTKMFNFFTGNKETEVKWQQIKTIGSDVILIDMRI